MCISRATVSAVSCLVVPAFICIDLLISRVLKINDDDDELSERLSAILAMKRSRKLSRSGWRDRQKISILVELTVCQKKCHKCIKLTNDYIEK